MATASTTAIPKYRSQKFHKFWLKITSFVIWSFGPVFFLGTMAGTSEPARLTLDLLSWPLDENTTFMHPDTQFLSALTGGFLMGWGLLVWCLSSWVYEKAPEGVRRSILVGLLTWFIFDSTGSIASGNAINALFNAIILLIGVGPLWLPAKD